MQGIVKCTVDSMKEFLRKKQQLIADDPTKFRGEKLLLGSSRQETIVNVQQWMAMEQQYLWGRTCIFGWEIESANKSFFKYDNTNTTHTWKEKNVSSQTAAKRKDLESSQSSDEEFQPKQKKGRSPRKPPILGDTNKTHSLTAPLKDAILIINPTSQEQRNEAPQTPKSQTLRT